MDAGECMGNSHIAGARSARSRRVALCAALLLVALPTVVAQAAPTATQFKLILQPVTLLYYYSGIDLTLDAATLTTLALPAGGGTQLPAKALTASGSASTLTANAAIAPARTNRMNAIQLTLDNAWAVRAIGSRNGRTTVSVRFASGSTATLTTPGAAGARIVLSRLSATPRRFTPRGLGTVQNGRLRMRMDLSRARAAGSYGTATIRISVTTT